MPRIHQLVFILLTLVSLGMHAPHFKKDLVGFHVWRQTQTQSTIDNFYEEDMNIFHPRRNERGDGDGIFRMEFPLMQWMTAAIYKVTGQEIIVTRLFMFIIGIVTVLGMYFLLLYLFNKKEIAMMGAWAFSFSPGFYYYTINPLPDNLALCCAVWGLALYYRYKKEQNTIIALSAGIVLSVATLCKLPFIVFFAAPGIDALNKLITDKKISIPIILLFAPVLLPAAWYLTVIPEWKGNGVVAGMLDNQISWPVFFDYLQHNLISTLPEILINYAALPFFIIGIWLFFKQRKFQNENSLSLIAISVGAFSYFLFEINMIGKVHDYYLFPFYPLIFILIAFGINFLLSTELKWKKGFVYFILILTPFTAWIRMHDRWNTVSPGFNPDLLIYKEELRSSVPDDALCIAGNDVSHFIFFYYIDKKGWGFHENWLSGNDIRNMKSKGAQYLFSDSRELEQRPDVSEQTGTLIKEFGSIRIYKL